VNVRGVAEKSELAVLRVLGVITEAAINDRDEPKRRLNVGSVNEWPIFFLQLF
jgi:hypothetical protein